MNEFVLPNAGLPLALSIAGRDTRPTLDIQLAHPNAKVPEYATDGSGCFDLFAASIMSVNGRPIRECDDITHALMYNKGDSVVIDTGIKVAVPKNHVLDVFSRSGFANKYGVTLTNAVGIIDSDYRGTVMVMLTRNHDHGDHCIIDIGQRIAQARVIYAPQFAFNVVEELSATARGAGGLGSTGVADLSQAVAGAPQGGHRA